MNDEQRDRERIPFVAHVLVKGKRNNLAMMGRLRDVAINSIYLKTDPSFAINEPVEINIVMPGASSSLNVKVPAVAVRKDVDGMAFRFDTPLEWWPLFAMFRAHTLEGRVA